jgi:hypothetical protein
MLAATTRRRTDCGGLRDGVSLHETRGLNAPMDLEEIDKTRYRQRLRFVFVGIVVVLTLVALGTSTLLIAIFGTPGASHFWLNLAGVIVGAAVVVLVLTKLRSHPYLHEVVYVWDLKQQLNRIARKQQVIEPLTETNDPDAIAVMYFFYRASQQLYELDDNTITLDTIALKRKALEHRIQELGSGVDLAAYRPAMLERF